MSTDGYDFQVPECRDCGHKQTLKEILSGARIASAMGGRLRCPKCGSADLVLHPAGPDDAVHAGTYAQQGAVRSLLSRFLESLSAQCPVPSAPGGRTS